MVVTDGIMQALLEALQQASQYKLFTSWEILHAFSPSADFFIFFSKSIFFFKNFLQEYHLSVR